MRPSDLLDGESTIRDILRKGVVSSLLLSALVGEGVVFGWYIFSQIRLRKHYESFVQEIVRRDSVDLVTSYSLGNKDAVLFQVGQVLDKVPVECAYLTIDSKTNLIKGDEENCSRKRASQAHWNNLVIASGGISFGPLEYTFASSLLTKWSDYQNLFLGFLVVFVFVILSWMVLARILTSTILDPLQKLTEGLGEGSLTLPDKYTCRELSVLSQAIKEFNRKLETSARLGAVADVARQVAHDIRSPLTALEVVAASASELPEEKRVLVRSAVSRITDIANSLLQRSRDTNVDGNAGPEPRSVQLLTTLAEAIITEKRLQLRSKLGVRLEAAWTSASYGLFAGVQPTEFNRMLSNLINNSVEAIPVTGTIRVTLEPAGSFHCLRVQDDGKGIPESILPQLMAKGATFGKAGGSGLGLHHAKTTVEAWGGRVAVHSIFGQGTTVEVYLPKVDPPKWFVPQLRLEEDAVVVILDDDTSIHQIWRGRFEPILQESKKNIKVVHCSTPEELYSWHQDYLRRSAGNYGEDHTIYLFDYELVGSHTNGLEIIERLGLQRHAVLVTSYYEEKEVRRRCERLGIRLIPKSLAGFVPIFA